MVDGKQDSIKCATFLQLRLSRIRKPIVSNAGLRKSNELEGRVALVTGAARNIGRAIARSLAAGGAAVMINAHTSREDAEKTAAMIDADGGRAACFMADVTDAPAVQAMVDETVKQFGRLDFLVNNGSWRPDITFEDTTLEQWRRVISVTLDGAFICTQACLPHLVRAASEGGGSIVNIGGLTGHQGAFNRVHVIAAKSGLAGMTKGLAYDFANKDITVNCVVPGPIDTARGAPGLAAERPEFRKVMPLVGRRGEPGEIGAMVRMLCGPDARFITGQSIHVNGGAWMP
jgi:3-oxoacyl-[acyl-carrier protein] reductase